MGTKIPHVIVPRLPVFQLYRCFHTTLRVAVCFFNLALHPWICDWTYVASFTYFILFITYHIITPFLYLKPKKRSLLVLPQKYGSQKKHGQWIITMKGVGDWHKCATMMWICDFRGYISAEWLVEIIQFLWDHFQLWKRSWLRIFRDF